MNRCTILDLEKWLVSYFTPRRIKNCSWYQNSMNDYWDIQDQRYHLILEPAKSTKIILCHCKIWGARQKSDLQTESAYQRHRVTHFDQKYPGKKTNIWSK